MKKPKKERMKERKKERKRERERERERRKEGRKEEILIKRHNVLKNFTGNMHPLVSK